MAKLPKKVSKYISKQIKMLRKEGRPQLQSIAIAFSKARRKFGERTVPTYSKLGKVI